MELNKSYFLEIEHYLQELVSNTEYIGTFIPLSERELDNKINGRNPGPYLILTGYRGALNENKQRTLGRRTLTFAVLQKAPHDKALEQRRIIDEAENIGLNIIAKIDLDASTGSPAWLKNAFIKESVRYEEMQYENLAGLFGQEFSLDLELKNTLKYDPNFWK